MNLQKKHHPNKKLLHNETFDYGLSLAVILLITLVNRVIDERLIIKVHEL